MSLLGTVPVIIFQKRDLVNGKEVVKYVENITDYDDGSIKSYTKRKTLSGKKINNDSVTSRNSWALWKDIEFGNIDYIRKGAPVPFPLFEETGIILYKERYDFTNNISFDGNFISQAAKNDSIVLELRARQNSFLTSAMIGLLQYNISNNETYGLTVSYFNDIVFCMDCFLGKFSIESGAEKECYNITLVIDKGKTMLDEQIRINKSADKKNGKGVLGNTQKQVVDPTKKDFTAHIKENQKNSLVKKEVQAGRSVVLTNPNHIIRN
jgi:hypothetical protein